MWFLSPSGWPTFADSDDEQWALSDRGYTLIDAGQVPAAIAAFNAGQPPPTSQDPLTLAEAATAIAATGNPLGDAARGAFGSLLRDAPPVTSTAAEVSNAAGTQPLLMDASGQLLRNGPGPSLQRSPDGTAWTTVCPVPQPITGIKQLDSGELVIGTADNYPANTVKAALYITDGYPTGGTVTVRKVLEASEVQQGLDMAWGFGGAGDVYVVSEYDGRPSGSRGGSQKVWLTEDSFATPPAVIYDHGNGELSSRHVHGAIYDPYRDAIWVTLGDYTGSATGDRRIRVSFDWRSESRTWVDVTTEHQPTAIVALPECVLFGQDSPPNGILRIDRPSPTNLRIDVAHKVSHYVSPVTNKPALSHVAAAPFRGALPGAPVLFPFNVAVADQHGLVIATTDGYAFEEVWRSAEPYAAEGYGPRIAVGPTPDGRILISGQNGGTFWHTEVAAPVPGVTRGASAVARSLALATPRRAYLAVPNETAPFQTIAGGTWAELILALGVPTFAEDPGDLFTVSPDGQGVVVNRDALVRIEVDSAMDGAFSGPNVAIAINGNRYFDTYGRSISRTMWIRAGQRVSGFGLHGGGGSPSVGGTDYALVLDAWETY